jgi:hypothetical protein
VSQELGTDFEERRVARLLTRAADAITPLSDVELAALARRAAVRPVTNTARRRWPGRRPQVFSVAAAAAAVALAVSLPIRSQEAADRTGPTSASADYLAAFPEGSALQLLLSQHGVEHA